MIRSIRKSAVTFFKKDSKIQNEWEMFYKKSQPLNKSFDPSAIMQIGKVTRFKVLIVLDEIAEMSKEFYNTEKITVAYNILGFEQKICINSGYTLRYGNTVPIKKVKLFYFFADNLNAVNKLLRQKDVFF